MSSVADPGARGDDQHIVAGIHEPVRDVPDCVGDAVDMREEGLGHDGDSHDLRLGRADEWPVTRGSVPAASIWNETV